MPRFIITCDDCGLSEGINLAALDLHQRGIATAASVMTNCTAAAHAFKLFAEYPNLEIGVHLNLTEGRPVTESPELAASNGLFYPPHHVLLRAVLPPKSYLQAIEAELTAQVDVCLQMGIQPQHLTTHMHFHILPSLHNIVLRLAHCYHIKWIRAYQLRSTVLPFNPLLQAVSQNHPAYLAPVMYWMQRNPDQFATTLNRLRGTVEIVVHPCTTEDETFPQTARLKPYQRFQEMAMLEHVYPLLRKEEV